MIMSSTVDDKKESIGIQTCLRAYICIKWYLFNLVLKYICYV